ncbi:flagellar hook-length control protein FliK [Bacillus methanolicus]|uniref:flagellar hook-length control protein FliK n=1 Tax=Bacillus methanolicus TaxID=1471 RepID=UPI00237FFB91|nr:flagellar hook-length control protein FliK [Bacillus methanolicus]MDE3838521.1 flagellar hook-length control protein FliK [Bacillus methanolicus]
MEIGGLGVVQSVMGSPKQTSSERSIGNFAGVLASFIKDTSAENGMIKETGTGLSSEELTDLIDFLQALDLAELEGGLDLIDQVQTRNVDHFLELILGYLGMDDKKWSTLVDRIRSFAMDAEGKQNAIERIFSDQIDGKKLDFDQFEILLPMVVAILSSADHSFTKDVADVAKAAKLYDLLSNYHEPFNRKNDLKLLIKQVAEKLESISFVHQQNGSKMEYLRKTFTPLASELNNQNVSERASEIKHNSIKHDGTFGTAFPLNQMSKAEQLTLMLDNKGKHVSTEQFIRQFESILAKSQFTKYGGTQKLFLKLYPEHLGSVRIELIQKDQSIVARILTTTGAAKDSLESQLQGLKQAFSSQNIQVDRIEISQQMTQQERLLNRDPHQQGQERHQEKHQQNKEHEKTKETALSFEQILLDTEV